jgi:phage terminase Nu1 subunit (DNA packaging protein)
MASQRKLRKVGDEPSGQLKGWARIADFLKMPVATAQRWAKAGMPIRREGRFTIAEADELRAWIAREAKMPAAAHIATNTADLGAGLKESIAAAKKRNRAKAG